MSYDLYLLQGDHDYSWFEENIENLHDFPLSVDWHSTCRTICAELKALNPVLVQNADQLDDDESGIQIGFYCDGTACISVSGWGGWRTAATQIRLYLDIFEKHGFAAYDQQTGRKWKRGWSLNEITALLERIDEVPPLTSTGKGSSLKPLTDDQWDSMM